VPSSPMARLGSTVLKGINDDGMREGDDFLDRQMSHVAQWRGRASRQCTDGDEC